MRTSAKFLRGHFLVAKDHVQAKAISDFQEIFQMFFLRICSKADYYLKEKRQRETRKSYRLPDER